MGFFDLFRSVTFPPIPVTVASIEQTPPSDSGQEVTKQLCLGYPPIRKAVLLIANKCASLPLHAIRYDSQGGKVRDYDHAGYKLLNEHCSDYLTPFVVKREIVVDAIFGNGLAYIVRDEFANPEQLLQLDSEQTTAERINGLPYYRTYMGSTEYRLPASDVFHIRSLGRELLADPLTVIARNALGLSLSLQTFAAKYFRNGQSGLTVVELPPGGSKDKDTRDTLITNWLKHYSGNQNAHKTVFPPPNTKVTRLANADNDASQMNESRNFDLCQIANLFGVEPHMLGSNVQSSYNSLEQQQQNFLDQALNPWLYAIEQEADAKLRTSTEERLGRIFFEYERKALLSMDTVQENTLLTSQLNNGLVSEEYARRVQNLPDKVDGETYRHPNTIVVEGVDDVIPPPVPEPELPDPQVPAPETDNASIEDSDLTDETNTDSDSSLERMTRNVLSRLVERVAKSKAPLNKHRDIWARELRVFARAEQVIDDLFTKTQVELDAVLPEQRADVLRRIDIGEITKQLCIQK